MKRAVRFRAAAVAVVALGLAIPTSAQAGSEYYFADSSFFGQAPPGLRATGARHSLTRISVRVNGTTSGIFACVWGADQNNPNVRNTAEYCAYPSDLGEGTFAGTVLRYPRFGNLGSSDVYARALSEW